MKLTQWTYQYYQASVGVKHKNNPTNWSIGMGLPVTQANFEDEKVAYAWAHEKKSHYDAIGVDAKIEVVLKEIVVHRDVTSEEDEW